MNTWYWASNTKFLMNTRTLGASCIHVSCVRLETIFWQSNPWMGKTTQTDLQLQQLNVKCHKLNYRWSTSAGSTSSAYQWRKRFSPKYYQVRGLGCKIPRPRPVSTNIENEDWNPTYSHQSQGHLTLQTVYEAIHTVCHKQLYLIQLMCTMFQCNPANLLK